MTWGECSVEGAQVVVRLRGWRRVLALRTELTVPLHSIARVDHDPLARAHVRTGLRQWGSHGHGVWRIGAYHGLDGWSFWSIGLGRNAVLIECLGERFRYVVIEVADARQTVEEIRVAIRKAAEGTARGPGTSPPTPADGPERRGRRGHDEPTMGED
jgi:hypothetical protein